ncbi:phosphopantetheinyl transferase [Flavobacterium album]|uniref:Phosphopantetheinyl transferase n=1 Tax=Flavobacterium album TaxID=2175091 RepID=A0A2S1R072_9FLAO|nr:4'-phosphopantetheinyl transferase superfamily protein [Flavobacterium album]AWH86026.1 phosphopantetheinyl transferase [Flavobacterium album]
MIGNDVIDLAAAKKESNWQREGFLQRLFSEEEQQAIANHPEQETMVWVLWSMKEAAYKAWNRQTRTRAFIPHLLHCSVKVLDSENFMGKVVCGDFKYHTQTSISDDALHTVAVADNSQKIHEPVNPEIIKGEGGLPFIRDKKKLLPASVSHHGRYRRVISVCD